MNRRPTRMTVLTLTAILLLTFLIPSKASAIATYVKIVGEDQGWIKGEVIKRDARNYIQVLSTQTLVNSPVDINGNLGTKVFSPLWIFKDVDRSSVGLLRAYINNELLTSVIIKHYDTRPKTWVHYFTLELTDCRVSGIEVDTNKVTKNHLPREVLGLTWKSMKYIDEIRNKSVEILWP